MVSLRCRQYSKAIGSRQVISDRIRLYQLLRSYLNAVYGEGDWVKGYSERQVYLNRTLIEDAKIPLEDIQKKVARFLIQFTGVASAYPYYAFEANDFGNGNLKRIINNFSPQRSGDVIVTLNPGWVEKEGDYVTNHNSPYEYDSHVPLIWYGWTVNRATVNRKGEYDRYCCHTVITYARCHIRMPAQENLCLNYSGKTYSALNLSLTATGIC
ncbi:MAG: hypothetical protein MZU84_02785 [Sphingobacterium sp.]|nr:hypothetical protein [Sphingobacterium sp.]